MPTKRSLVPKMHAVKTADHILHRFTQQEYHNTYVTLLGKTISSVTHHGQRPLGC